MKTVFALIAVLGLALPTMADESKESGDAFVTCYGDHHGSYLDFTSNQDGSEITVHVSTDAGDAVVIAPYKISVLEKDGAAVTDLDKTQSLITVVNDMNDQGADYTGFVFARAENSTGNQMYLNLNKFDGTSYLVTDGYVEPLTCTVPQH